MTEQLSRAVAAEIRRLLEERDISGNQLAKETGISQPSIARKLRGATAFDLDDVDLICAALGVKVADLLDWAQK
jgi:DNA-binding Xre family transcriptional regulator